MSPTEKLREIARLREQSASLARLADRLALELGTPAAATDKQRGLERAAKAVRELPGLPAAVVAQHARVAKSSFNRHYRRLFRGMGFHSKPGYRGGWFPD